MLASMLRGLVCNWQNRIVTSLNNTGDIAILFTIAIVTNLLRYYHFKLRPIDLTK